MRNIKYFITYKASKFFKWKLVQYCFDVCGIFKMSKPVVLNHHEFLCQNMDLLSQKNDIYDL